MHNTNNTYCIAVIALAIFITSCTSHIDKIENDAVPPEEVEQSSSSEQSSIRSKKQENTDETNLPTVIQVIDGDTIDVLFPDGTEERVRIVGIDTPETGHIREEECLGEEAGNWLRDKILREKVVLVAKPDEERDQHNRLLRYIEHDDIDVGMLLIREGYAEHYDRYPHPRGDVYDAVEKGARSREVGIWSDRCAEWPHYEEIAPSQIPTAGTPERGVWDSGCRIKGVVRHVGSAHTVQKYYHLSTCPDYGSIQISFGDGEQYFCTQEEAQEAGWIQAENCGDSF